MIFVNLLIVLFLFSSELTLVQTREKDEVKEVQNEDNGPIEAPSGFRKSSFLSGTHAFFIWQEVENDSIRGYKIHTWVDGKEDDIKETLVKPDTSMVLISSLVPDALNYAKIMAFTDRIDGPFSNVISFETPEGVPSTVESLEAFRLGSTAFMLQWKRPIITNGRLLGYRIFYEEMEGHKLFDRRELVPKIDDPDQTQAKLAGLKSDTKYRILIAGYTRIGTGEEYYIEQKTSPAGSAIPDKPSFEIEKQFNEMTYEYDSVKITWKPNLHGHAGSNFYVQYRKKGESEFRNEKEEINEDSYVVAGLKPDTDYEFRVVSVDAEYQMPSESRFISTLMDI